MESCYARLEERANADSDARKDWKSEVERRLLELNHFAQRALAERDMFLTKEAYEARHADTTLRAEQSSRELNTAIGTLSTRVETRMVDHEREDIQRHRDDGVRITACENFKLREEAGIETRREATTRSRWVFGAVITVANLLLYLFLHFAVGVK